MLKIIDSKQMHLLDSKTMENMGMSSLELMECAANALSENIMQSFPDRGQRFVVFCGSGNNGGDGLAVSRILYNEGYDVDCYAIRSFSHYSPDYESNYQRIAGISILHNIKTVDELPALHDCDVVIDAIFGSGINRAVTGFAAQVIDYINANSSFTVSIDIPSGLTDCGIARNIGGAVVRAHKTLTIEIPFLSMLIPENDEFVGDLSIVSIGLDLNVLNDMSSFNHLIQFEDIRLMAKPRRKFSHKGTFGHTLLISGAKGKAGAAVLCSRACHRAGTGLLTTHVPGSLLDILQISTPETMVSTDSNSNVFSQLPDISRYSAIGAGPGLGQDSLTAKALSCLIDEASVPLVLDADALNIVASDQSLLQKLPKNTILTPHPKEFERLFGKTGDSIQRLQVLRDNAVKYGIIIVLKGANTAVAMPDGNVYFNTTGNPGMATAGSGDVLTGIIAGLLSQKYSPGQAALMGVYVHGLSGDVAAERLGLQGLIASDIVDCIPLALKRLFN